MNFFILFGIIVYASNMIRKRTIRENEEHDTTMTKMIKYVPVLCLGQHAMQTLKRNMTNEHKQQSQLDQTAIGAEGPRSKLSDNLRNVSGAGVLSTSLIIGE
jgi:hypothetical protein